MGDTSKIAVQSVRIEIAGSVLELTLEQVRELKNILGKAFPEPEVKWIPSAPVVIEPFRDHPYRYWEPQVWCGSQSGPTEGSVLAICLK